MMLTFHELSQGIASSRPNWATKEDCVKERREGEEGEGKKERKRKGRKGEGNVERGEESTQNSLKSELSTILAAIHLFPHSANVCGYCYPGIKNKNTVSGLVEFII